MSEMKDWEYDQKEIENESYMTSIYGHFYRKYKWHGSKTNYDMECNIHFSICQQCKQGTSGDLKKWVRHRGYV